MDSRSSRGSTLPPQMPVAGQNIWHRVVGIICIVFGAGAALQSIVGIIGQGPMAKLAQQQMTEASAAAHQALMTQWSGKLVVLGGATGLIALVLVVSGILLLFKKRKAVVALKTWAGLKIALLLVTIPITAGFQKAVAELQFAGALAGEGAEFAASAGRIWIVVAIAAQVIWGLILPVFILVWFSRKKIREQVAFWD
ncbi:MAG: hypothetical protein KDN22_05045 [Verrucomicrobiae bacterium]|nr:hypothetical protein [Verrucomicrobiae bacterium]